MVDEPVEASADFDRRFMRTGKHSTLLTLPKAYLADIGAIIAHWGNFETLFNLCLKGLVEGEARDKITRDVEGWTRLAFKRRRKLFKAICREWVREWDCPHADALISIVDRSGSLANKRNMIAHGTFTFAMLPHSRLAVECRAINYETGEKMPFDELVLKKIHHDISHLTADLLHEFRKHSSIEGPFLTLPDAEILRIFRETNHP